MVRQCEIIWGNMGNCLFIYKDAPVFQAREHTPAMKQMDGGGQHALYRSLTSPNNNSTICDPESSDDNKSSGKHQACTSSCKYDILLPVSNQHDTRSIQGLTRISLKVGHCKEQCSNTSREIYLKLLFDLTPHIQGYHTHKTANLNAQSTEMLSNANTWQAGRCSF